MIRVPISVGLGLLLLAPACATYEPLPLPKGLLDLQGAVFVDEEAQGWIGIQVLPNESDSLDDLEVMPGVRVRSVAEGSPAEMAGIRPGHVLLRFGETPVDDPGRLESLLRGIQQAGPVTCRLQRGSQVFETEVQVQVRQPGAKRRLLYHIERGLLRAAFRDTTDEGAFPEVAFLTEDSPLRKAGVKEGDRIVAFLGRDPGSAAELVRRIPQELDVGQTGQMTVLKPSGKRKEVEFQTWQPEREMVRLAFWPLFHWSFERSENRESLEILDLWLFSLFSKERIGAERQYSILSLISWRTGEPMLEEIQLPGGNSAGANPPAMEGNNP